MRGREGNRLRNSAPLDNWETKDGQFICIVAAGDGLFPRLARAIGREELLADPRFSSLAARAQHGDAINSIVGEWCRAHTRTGSKPSARRPGAGDAAPFRSPTSSTTALRGAQDIVTVDDPTSAPEEPRSIRASRRRPAASNAAHRSSGSTTKRLPGLLGVVAGGDRELPAQD